MRAYRVAYDGTAYRGFQRQPDVHTTSDAILDALRALDVLEPGAVPAGYAAAGRTDAGVSATHQTVAFEGPDWLEPAALNAELPADIRAWASAEVPEDFHATHDASCREYTYSHHTGSDGGPTGGDGVPAVHLDRARKAAAALSGEHDFHNLTTDDTGTVRDLDVVCETEGPFLVLTVRADGFPRQLVRRLVTVIAAVARGEVEVAPGEVEVAPGEAEVAQAGDDTARIERLLGAEPVEGPRGVEPAPAHPLVLTDVTYPGVEFAVDESAAASAREVFEARRRRLATRARVAGRLRDR